MRVALVSIGDPEVVNTWSGIPNSILRELKQQLEQGGGSVHIITLNRGFRYAYILAKLWHRLRKSQIQLDRHPFALRQYRRQLMRGLKGIQVDALIATSSIPLTSLKLDIPTLFWTDAVFDAMVDYYPAAFTGLTPRELAICHRQEQQALTAATFALYSSTWAVETAKRHYAVDASKLHVAEFGANLAASLTPPEVESLIAARTAGPTLNLLWVGVDWQRKGGDVAFEATRLLNERGLPSVLHVAGCSSPESPWVRNYGFLDRATPAGREQLAALFRQAGFFLFPTQAEAAGIVFAEASSFALPIVTRDTGGVATYVSKHENGIRLPPDAPAEQYAATIAQLWQDPARYKQLALGARAAFEHRLNWGASVRKALQLLSTAQHRAREN